MPRDLEGQLAEQLDAAGLTGYQRQFRFAPPRRWLADFAWIEQRLLVEVQGKIWHAGRHTRGSGYLKDCQRMRAAQLAGYRIFYVVDADLKSGAALADIAAALERR